MARLPLANLDLDNPVLRGETFDAMRSIDVGLIDGIQTLNEALMEAKHWDASGRMSVDN